MDRNDEALELADVFSFRRPIPVSTIDWTTTNLSQLAPVTGLDFLIGADQILIQQTVGLHDMLSETESENRYTVKVPQGETLFSVEENSEPWQRRCCGSNRAFSLVVYDQTKQFSMQMNRRLACNCSLFGCRLQKMEIFIPPGDYIGSVTQRWTLFTPLFLIDDPNGNPLFQIEGPRILNTCRTYKDCDFHILNGDGDTQLGSIRHQWDQLMVGYNLCVYFPERAIDVKEKGLLMAAAFLMEYMYFETGKSKSWRCCC